MFTTVSLEPATATMPPSPPAPPPEAHIARAPQYLEAGNGGGTP